MHTRPSRNVRTTPPAETAEGLPPLGEFSSKCVAPQSVIDENWVRRLIFHHGKRRPQEIGVPDIEALVTHLAVADVSASTQALCGILFLYKCGDIHSVRGEGCDVVLRVVIRC